MESRLCPLILGKSGEDWVSIGKRQYFELVYLPSVHPTRSMPSASEIVVVHDIGMFKSDDFITNVLFVKNCATLQIYNVIMENGERITVKKVKPYNHVLR